MVSLRLPPLPTIRDIIKIYRLSAIKELSQNFLLDERLSSKIVKCTGKISGSQVLEIGAGPGGITRSILRKFPEKLIVIEKDKRFEPTLNLLKDAFCLTNNKMQIIFNDIMNIDMEKLFDSEKHRDWNDQCPNIYLIGNLPFNISTALFIQMIQNISEKKGAWSYGRVQMILAFQKEVAERIVAQITESQRCRLSVLAQAWTLPKLKFIIPGNAFVPKPDVDVGIVSFTPLKRPRTIHTFELFEKVNRHLFSFRQKYSIKCAGTLFPPGYGEHLAKLMFELADVRPEIRPFNLTVEDISRLASSYKYLCEKYPEIINYNYRASKKVLSKKFTKSIIVQDYSKNNIDSFYLM